MLCSFCHYIGHSADQCRKAKVAPAGGGELDKGKHLHDNAPARKKKKWVEVEGEQKQSKRIVHIGTVVEKIHAEQEKLETSNSYEALQNLDSGEETVPETQLSAGDIMDLVTGGSAMQHSLKEKMITAARECAMNRQLRDECDATSSAAQKDTPAAAAADSDSGKELEAQPTSTPSATVAPTPPAAAPNMDIDQTEAAGKDPPTPSCKLQDVAEPADQSAIGSMSGGEGSSHIPLANQLEPTSNRLVAPPPAQARTTAAPVDTFTNQNEAAENAQEAAGPTDPNAADMLCDFMTGEEGKWKKDTLVPAPTKCITKRTKNKRKATESSTRQLRSLTKNKAISETTPEMIEAYIRNQYQPKAT